MNRHNNAATSLHPWFQASLDCWEIGILKCQGVAFWHLR